MRGVSAAAVWSFQPATLTYKRSAAMNRRLENVIVWSAALGWCGVVWLVCYSLFVK